jgi:hypothetical protein
MVMAALAYWGVGLPASWVAGFALGWGAAGVWTGLVAGLATAAVLLLHRFFRVTVPALRAGAAPPDAGGGMGGNHPGGLPGGDLPGAVAPAAHRQT